MRRSIFLSVVDIDWRSVCLNNDYYYYCSNGHFGVNAYNSGRKQWLFHLEIKWFLSVWLYHFNLIKWFLMATSGTKPIIVPAGHVYILLHQREKWESTIQYGYRKLGTRARVFSQTLTHGNSKIEIRQWDHRRDAWVWKKSTAGTNKKKSRRPITS